MASRARVGLEAAAAAHRLVANAQQALVVAAGQLRQAYVDALAQQALQLAQEARALLRQVGDTREAWALQLGGEPPEALSALVGLVQAVETEQKALGGGSLLLPGEPDCPGCVPGQRGKPCALHAATAVVRGPA